jgi:hypothetical protein
VTSALFLEILIRLILYKTSFFKSRRNNADLFLAGITAIMQIPKIHNSGELYAWLTVFQILRIYRLILATTLARDLIVGSELSILEHMLILNQIFLSLKAFNIVLFVFLSTFLVSILAVELLRGNIPEYDDKLKPIDNNFSTLFESFLGMYQILVGKDWTDILYNITASKNMNRTAWAGAMFCIFWSAITFCMSLLFLASFSHTNSSSYHSQYFYCGDAGRC